jgi:uncharacterized membrane protein
MDHDLFISAMVTILIAAGVTYSFRVGGLLLSDKLPQNGPFKRFMQALPGTILLSLVAPGIVAAGLWGGIAALATAICAFKTRNVFLSMLVGMAIIIVQRNFL